MIIAFPHPPGSGGPGSFQVRFEEEAKKAGHSISYFLENEKPDIILVVGGTKKLGWLWKMKKKGIPIIYRLDGINWLHRKKKTSLKYFLIAEYRNLNNRLIHAFLSDFIIYQSQFVKEWWIKTGWRTPKEYTIIHNGVDLNEFNVQLNAQSEISVVCLEGSLDYSPYAIGLLNQLSEALSGEISLIVYGSFEDAGNREKLNSSISFRGKVDRKEVPSVFNNCIYLSLDVNAACPNTVIEALACGVPVVGFDTGSLKELVTSDCGEIVPYGSDPWELQMPNIDSLIGGILKIKREYSKYSLAARQRAIDTFNIVSVFEKYMQVIQSKVHTDL